MSLKQTTILPSKILSRGLHHHPAVISEARKRASSPHLRIADAITGFAGSMPFVYANVVLIVLWLALFEAAPWTGLVIFLTTESTLLCAFVLLTLNRQTALAQTVADQAPVPRAPEAELGAKVDALTQRIDALTDAIGRRGY
jgi:uncharacterized membrane protein